MGSLLVEPVRPAERSRFVSELGIRCEGRTVLGLANLFSDAFRQIKRVQLGRQQEQLNDQEEDEEKFAEAGPGDVMVEREKNWNHYRSSYP